MADGIETSAAGGIPFLKMHGLGNHFVIIDARTRADPMFPARAQAIGDRCRGVGYDQLAVLHPGDGADAGVTFWNPDGSRAGACGNASRCIARLLMEETGRNAVSLRTDCGVLPARRVHGDISVNMGQPRFAWQDIPLARAVDTDRLPLSGTPAAVGMGNPHCVFFVEDAAAVILERVGPQVEHDPLFPHKTNVEFVQVIDRRTLRVRVWERGTGVTLACGSGTCAAAAAAHRRGLVARSVTVRLDGGALKIDWQDDGVWMTGATRKVFSGVLDPEFLS
ncbi:MAG: diaminopimelate epimerase [Rhodobacteraceae bacterium]|nr:diaminopimelate epimerase [Paracoccaceae bacterium]